MPDLLLCIFVVTFASVFKVREMHLEPGGRLVAVRIDPGTLQ